MLHIDQLSFWEQKTYFEGIDFMIVGSGIVGITTALELRKQHPLAKIVIFERGYLPSGASTKNAGFTCFGSATEILDDLKKMDESLVWSTVEKRWKGLQRLKALAGVDFMDYQQHGSWDIITKAEAEKVDKCDSQLPYLNKHIESITGHANVYKKNDACADQFGFQQILTSYENTLEGQIDTGKLITRLHALAVAQEIHFIFGIEVLALQSNLYHVAVQTQAGFLKAKHVLICTNGFARQFLPNRDINPARAQVLVTTPIPDLKVKGTFHYQEGYYYFRNFEERILLGGGRNLDFEGETTTNLDTTSAIQEALTQLLSEVILPGQAVGIAYRWAGIMGVGSTKAPIVERIDERIAVGVRLGGMGVAIGSLVGQELAELFH